MADLNKSRQNPFKCEICDKEFRDIKGLKNHLNLVHKLMGEHQCNICQSVFKLQKQLNSHVKMTFIPQLLNTRFLHLHLKNLPHTSRHRSFRPL